MLVRCQHADAMHQCVQLRLTLALLQASSGGVLAWPLPQCDADACICGPSIHEQPRLSCDQTDTACTLLLCPTAFAWA